MGSQTVCLLSDKDTHNEPRPYIRSTSGANLVWLQIYTIRNMRKNYSVLNITNWYFLKYKM